MEGSVAVFVIDADGKHCLPSRSMRARKLLEAGKATVTCVMPFTIQLKRRIDNPIGSFTAGIDDGATTVGVAIVNEHTQECVFTGEINLRQDVSRKMKQRAVYRKARRSRLRYREARFDNRAGSTINPSTRCRKDSVIRFIKNIMAKINITKVVVEEGQFDTSSLVAGRKLRGVEFQKAEYEGRSFRAKVLWRDKYICQHCKTTKWLEAHHIKFRNDGGTNTVANGITLCKECHKRLHIGEWELVKKPKRFTYPSWLMVGKTYLREQIIKLGLQYETVYGWMTSCWRKEIGLIKSHANDAISMVCMDYSPIFSTLNWMIKPRRTKVWEDNPTKICVEKNGFRHYDIVRAIHRTRGVITGSIRSLKSKAITIRTTFDDNFPISYSKTKLLQRPNGLVFCRI